MLRGNRRKRRVGVLVVNTQRARALVPVLKDMILNSGAIVTFFLRQAGEELSGIAADVDCVVFYDDGSTEDPVCRQMIAALPPRLQRSVIVVRPYNKLHAAAWKDVRKCCLRRKAIRRAVTTFARHVA